MASKDKEIPYRSFYSDFILKNMPKVLSQIDRDEHSQTYGSCDRNHWHLKIRDFTSAILQQTGLTLALLYSTDFKGNIYYQNANIKKWAKATLYYWAKIQLNDGSYNEYYPHEHGFPPTAFSLFTSCKIYKYLSLEDEYIINKIKKTAAYLAENIEDKAYNQEIASITALYSAYQIIEEIWIKKAINKKLIKVLEAQSIEGWFPEYGGADLGYLSVSLDMMAEYYYQSKDERVEKPLKDMVEFIKYFVHTDGSVGGEYGSRNTSYFLPAGLEILIQKNLAAEIASGIKNALFRKTNKYNYFMDSVDDRYFTHYLMHSFLRALAQEKTGGGTASIGKPLPCRYTHEKYFSDSGLLSVRKNNYHAVVSLRKGGIIKLFNDKKEFFIDCGYRVNFGGGHVGTMNWLDQDYKIFFENGKASVTGSFNDIRLKVSTPLLHTGLRCAAFLLGNKLIGILKKKIIFNTKKCGIYFKRSFIFSEDSVEITDSIKSNNPVTIEKASTMSLRHVASGKFFTVSDLICESGEKYGLKDNLIIKTRVELPSGKIICFTNEDTNDNIC